MIVIMIILALSCVIITSPLIWFIWSLDCDLTLYLASRFGRKISGLKGKVIWITGASSGIGESLAYQLSGVKAKLILSGTDEKRLADVKKKCLMLGKLRDDEILVLPFNMKRLDIHSDQLEKVIKHFKKLDILVNNAGRSQRAFFHETDISVDQEMFQINVMGTINLSRLVLNHWYKTQSNGHFVMTSSTLGKLSTFNGSTYAATKHALHGYFEGIRAEAYSKGIRVTFTCPGPVISRATERSFTSKLGQSFHLADDAKTRKMSTARCALLMAIAMVNQLDEVWICFQPILLLQYAYQYFPSVCRMLLPRFLTKERIDRMREGK